MSIASQNRHGMARRRRLMLLVGRVPQLYVLVVILALLAAYVSVSTGAFLTEFNLTSLARQLSFTGIMAVGATFVVLTAGIDLSVAATLAFTGMVCANLLENTAAPVPIVVGIALLIGTLFGAVNGVLVTIVRLPPFIATISTLYVYRGLTYVIALKQQGFVSNAYITNTAFTGLGQGLIGVVPYPTAIFIAILLVGVFLLYWTRFGAYCLAIGGAEAAARMSGVPVVRTKLLAYSLSGFTAALAGVLLTARMGTATPDAAQGGCDLDL